MYQQIHNVHFVVRRSAVRSGHGTGNWVYFEEHTMTTLLYRGHAYEQCNVPALKADVQLTYRRSTYQARQHQARQASVQLTYRGLSYVR